ncbi:MAG: ECF transporter S component, partial [Acutalibacteraceae bacterium]
MKVNKTLTNIVTTALFAAIIAVTTAYIFHIPVGTNGGYIHIGDCFIYLAACFLPLPYAMLA